MRALLLCLLLLAPSLAETDPASLAFFERWRALDGRTFEGRMVYPTDRPDHEMAGKPMLLRVQVVSAEEIRIPFQVGEDASRTWILRQTVDGLLLKHDHRLADGSPDPVTMYGGLALPGGLGLVQIFPADRETAAMLPEASSNAWCLEFSPDGQRLTYTLERHQQPRFQAVFQPR
ncbi:MAG: hypothetical protein AMXMBFR33_56710 [Candidatus Xenobia bacterium]